MDERMLLKISLCVSILGLFLLTVMLNFFTVSDVEISKIASEKEGRSVRVKGFVESVRNHEGFAAVEIAELKTVSAIIFTSENITLKKGERLEITGRVRNYNGKNELIVERMRKA